MNLCSFQSEQSISIDFFRLAGFSSIHNLKTDVSLEKKRCTCFDWMALHSKSRQDQREGTYRMGSVPGEE